MRLVEVPEFGGTLGEMHGLVLAEVVHRPLTAQTLQYCFGEAPTWWANMR